MGLEGGRIPPDREREHDMYREPCRAWESTRCQGANERGSGEAGSGGPQRAHARTLRLPMKQGGAIEGVYGSSGKPFQRWKHRANPEAEPVNQKRFYSS